ncbi:hypothetical protein ACFL40_04340, partial [candidate division KSB1 bacterium]
IITKDLYFFPPNLEEEYKSLKNRELNEEENKKAQELVSIYRHQRAKTIFYDYCASVSEFSGVGNIVKKIKKYYFSGLRKITSIKDVIKFSTYARKIRLYCHAIFYSRLFHNIIEDENYFYFPLQYQPEVTVDIMAPFYKEQKIVVDFVSKSLPAGYKLAVKEHPHAYGLRPIKYYKEIAKNPRVKLIKIGADGYDLIKRSSGVISLSGTSGWQAFINGKPVVVFGNIFYKLAENGVYFVDNIYKLPYIFQEIIRDFSPDEDEILKFCYAVYNCTYDGFVGPPFYDSYIMTDENIKNVTNAIISEYKKIG